MTTNDELLLGYRRMLLGAGRAQGTIRERTGMMKNFAAHYGADLCKVTLERLEQYMALKALTLAPESLKSIRSTLRTFFSWLEFAGYVDRSPAEHLRAVRVPPTVARRASDAAVHASLVTASLEEKAMILLGRLAGLRLSEIASLRVDARLGDMLLVKGKGGRERYVPIPSPLDEVLTRLAHMVDGVGYYFPGRFGGHVSGSKVHDVISTRVGSNPHSLRHAYATAAYNGSGRDIRAVQEALGHSSPTTTQRYVHVSADAVRAAAAAAAVGFADAGSTAIERTEGAS